MISRPQSGGPHNSHLVGVAWLTVAAGRSFDAPVWPRLPHDAARRLSPLDIQLANEAAVFLVLFAKVRAEIRAARSNWKEP